MLPQGLYRTSGTLRYLSTTQILVEKFNYDGRAPGAVLIFVCCIVTFLYLSFFCSCVFLRVSSRSYPVSKWRRWLFYVSIIIKAAAVVFSHFYGLHLLFAVEIVW